MTHVSRNRQISIINDFYKFCCCKFECLLSCWLTVLPTGQNNLHQVPLLDIRHCLDQLQDVIAAGVVLEEEDLVIDPIKATFRKLDKTKKAR